VGINAFVEYDSYYDIDVPSVGGLSTRQDVPGWYKAIVNQDSPPGMTSADMIELLKRGSDND
jgi:hypothetical protein